jgi:hypothetical protein
MTVKSAINEIIKECQLMQQPQNTKRTSKFNRGWKMAAYNIELSCNIILGRDKYKKSKKSLRNNNKKTGE